ncbi:hypothetical protein L6452_12309 [Arctium lappa]|uniref:Uncharacterized protein n=1 Tax=Arctium lappa TaxID=4217 RepID=A0ACB9DQY4_ARCLA|nr:hypothetical protein L6452_12309 [Arctium lappa]
MLTSLLQGVVQKRKEPSHSFICFCPLFIIVHKKSLLSKVHQWREDEFELGLLLLVSLQRLTLPQWFQMIMAELKMRNLMAVESRLLPLYISIPVRGGFLGMRLFKLQAVPTERRVSLYLVI